MKLYQISIIVISGIQYGGSVGWVKGSLCSELCSGSSDTFFHDCRETGADWIEACYNLDSNSWHIDQTMCSSCDCVDGGCDSYDDPDDDYESFLVCYGGLLIADTFECGSGADACN